MTLDTFSKRDIFEQIGAEEPLSKRRKTDDIFTECLGTSKPNFELSDENDPANYLVLNREESSNNSYLFLAIVLGLMCLSNLGGKDSAPFPTNVPGKEPKSKNLTSPSDSEPGAEPEAEQESDW